MHFSKPPLGTPLDWGNPLNDETVLALAMNEGHGDKVQDLSLNGNHGTLHNFAFPPTAASGWNPGQTGIGLNFDGTNNYINCGNGPSLDITNAITIAARAKTTDKTLLFQSLVCKRHPIDGTQYLLRIDDDDLRFYVQGIGTVLAQNVIKKNNRWYDLVGTYDGNDAYLYVDGAEVYHLADATGFTTNTADVFIGRRTDDASQYLAGQLDRVRIQSRAWTAKEVRDYSINPWQVYLDEND